MSLSTHVLNLVSGQPVAGLSVTVYKGEETVGRLVTDEDGRCPDLLSGQSMTAGDYKLVFDVGAYFAARNTETFYQLVPIEFTISDLARHYHVPLLLSPYGYSTYRGS